MPMPDDFNPNMPEPIEPVCPECGFDGGAEAEAEIRRLLHALELSVRLQSQYARILNAHDGSERRLFATADEWLARLRSLGAPEEAP
jgi:hypothetical protein